MAEINPISYVEIPSYGIDDVQKRMFEYPYEMMMKTADKKAEAVKNIEIFRNTPLSFIDKVNFIPGQEPKGLEDFKKEFSNTIDEISMNPSDPESLKKISELSRKTSEYFGERGEFGISKLKYDVYDKILKDNAEKIRSLTDEEGNALRNNLQDIISEKNNSFDIRNIANEYFVHEVPNFTEILSNDNLKAIVNASGYNGNLIETQGLPPEGARKVIQAALSENEEIRNWIEQKNRLLGTDYNTENIFNSDGSINDKVPGEIKDIIEGAYKRVTNKSTGIMKTEPSGKGGGRGNTGGGRGNTGGGEEKEESFTSSTVTRTLHVNNPTDTLKVKELYESGNSRIGSMIADKMAMKNNGTAINKNEYDYIFKNDWDSILGIRKEDKAITYSNEAIESISDKIDDLKVVYGEDGYTKVYMVNGDEPVILYAVQGNVGKQAKKILSEKLKSYYKILNDMSMNSEAIIKPEFTSIKSIGKNDLNSLNNLIASDKFNIMIESESGYSYPESTASYKNFSIENIHAINMCSSESPLSLDCTIKSQSLEEPTRCVLVLKPKYINGSTIGDICGVLNKYISNTDNTIKYLTERPQLISIGYAIQNGDLTDYDKSTGIMTREFTINGKTMKNIGIQSLPSAFMGMTVKTKKVKGVEMKIETFFGNDSSTANNLTYQDNDIFGFLSLMHEFYRIFNNVKKGEDYTGFMKEYLLSGGADIDPYTEGDQTYFAQRKQENNFTYEKIIRDENMTPELKCYARYMMFKEQFNNASYAKIWNVMSNNASIKDRTITNINNVCLGDCAIDEAHEEIYMVVYTGNRKALMNMKTGIIEDNVRKSQNIKYLRNIYR